MATLWIAVLAAVVALGAAWMRLRGRRAPRDAGSVAPAQQDRRPRPADDAVARTLEEPAAADSIDAERPDSDRVILERLCAAGYAATGEEPAQASASVAVQAPTDAATQAAHASATATLAGIRAHPRYTPRRPHLLPQLTRAINDPAATAQSIAAILAQDPALAGNLLRVANSVVYRRRAAPIEDLERAVTRLGTEGLRQTAMAALLQPVITDDGSVLARCAARLWDHTLMSAHLASSAKAGAGPEDRHAAQLLALLHGLGSVAVVQVVRDAWAKSGAGTPDLQMLVSLLDAWSLRCARAISADWGLSERALRTLDALAEGEGDEGPDSLGRALKLGRALAAAAMPGDTAELRLRPEPA